MKSYYIKWFNFRENILVLVRHLTTVFRMGFFGAAHRSGDQKGSLSRICRTYPALMKLFTVILYLKGIYILSESRDTSLDFC